MASLNNIYINEFYRSYFNTNKKRPPWTSHGQALSGLRVLKFDGLWPRGFLSLTAAMPLRVVEGAYELIEGALL